MYIMPSYLLANICVNIKKTMKSGSCCGAKIINNKKLLLAKIHSATEKSKTDEPREVLKDKIIETQISGEEIKNDRK